MQRLFLLMVFCLSVYLLVDAWQREQGQIPATQNEHPGKAQQVAPTPGEKLTAVQQPPNTPQASASEAGQKISVTTDYLLAEIDTAGGDLRKLELLKHRDTLNKKKNFMLFQYEPEHIYIAQSGLIGHDLPTHKTQFSADAKSYELKPGEERLEVRLMAPAVDGIKVTKVYTFHKSSYLIDVSY